MTWAYAFEQPPAGDPDELRALLGGKGANLVVMTSELGLPVPAGFVISTAACRAYMADGWPDGLDEELRGQMAGVEARAGRRFGDAGDPLLVSVRSGAPMSMPGMLDTILNLGLNDATTEGLAGASGDAGFALACRQRLDAMFRDIVGVESVPDDPWQQLRAAIEAVFRSWGSERAQSYREREGIPADLGTAVVVQAMVFGNRGSDSATGVLFTRDPATGENVPYGDILFDAQGEDVVAGTHETQPISSLDERLPDVADELRRYADVLERHHADVCDIEFTIESGRLWMLQNRIGKRSARAALRTAMEMAEDASFPLDRRGAVERVASILADPPRTVELAPGDQTAVVATGLPASPGLGVGVVATTPEKAVELAEQGQAAVLVRTETSPDDVHGMARSVGILTTTGGLASHAAVVARGWDIPAVVGARDVTVDAGRVRIGERRWVDGDAISIDGSSGAVYAGRVGSVVSVDADAATLLAWADELGIDLKVSEAYAETTSDMPSTDGPTGAVLSDDVLRSLSIKGYVTPELMAPALGLDVDGARAALVSLEGEGLAAENAAMFSLTDDGKARGREMLAADISTWGEADAKAALDGFLDLDARMKTIVTAWQMKTVDGEQVLNDHADMAYDEAVLADLAALHVEVTVWLTPHVVALPRLAAYARRLDAAAAAAASGEPTYIASPRVDSYHGVWFELHEDLIRLAGTTREEETAAGRA